MSASVIKPFKETGEHSYHRRCFTHDYFAPFIYHIILKKGADCEWFGSVTGDAKIAPGNPGCARINESSLGRIIAKAILHLPYQFPAIKLHQFSVMPDHVHILIQVLYRSGKHLDFYIDGLKNYIASKYATEKRLLSDASVFSSDMIFEAGYCDKPLYEERSLDSLYRYIRENPHRLAMRKQYPRFFQRVRKLKIGDKEYEAYGNLFLFRNPDKMAVKISRSFSLEEKARKREEWLYSAANGGVLVSPFISPAEKNIRAEAEALGGRTILITHEAFTNRFKPAAHDFELCAAGSLLIISLGLPAGTTLSRSHCLAMNALAGAIAGTN